MKFHNLIAALMVAICLQRLQVSAATYENFFSGGFANSGLIPDDNAAGWADSRVLNLGGNPITDVSLKLDISGGFNGDLYAYLRHGNVLVPLLNRVGVTAGSPSSLFGYPDPGFEVALDSSGPDVHLYQRSNPIFNGSGQLTGTWQADGRTIDPSSPPASFDSAPRVGFSALNSLDPDGTWTLFIADLGGGEQSRLVSWELDITTVPEPGTLALGMLALMCLFAVRRRKIADQPRPTA